MRAVKERVYVLTSIKFLPTEDQWISRNTFNLFLLCTFNLYRCVCIFHDNIILFVHIIIQVYIENSLRPTLECHPWREVISTIPIYRRQWQLYCPNHHSSPCGQLHSVWELTWGSANCLMFTTTPTPLKILVAKQPSWGLSLVATSQMDSYLQECRIWDVGAPLPTSLPSTILLCTQLTNTKHIWQNGTRLGIV